MELAGEFHSYYNKNKVLGNKTRLILISAIKKVLSEGLEIIGVEAPEKM
jgi:arginyl-tRNA synthetase